MRREGKNREAIERSVEEEWTTSRQHRKGLKRGGQLIADSDHSLSDPAKLVGGDYLLEHPMVHEVNTLGAMFIHTHS